MAFEYEKTAAQLVVEHQAELEQRYQAQRAAREKAERYETLNEQVFDEVVKRAGGAPTREAASLVWELINAEALPCEAIAQAVIDKGHVAVEPPARINEALDIARRYGGIDGDHHKAWTIDQMCRVLSGENYRTFVADAKSGEDGPDSYDWDVGCPP